ncbi:MAG TPA: long-chain-fatty-acid--CoA ligase [Methanomicrobia archaeon]|nr:long-chain-fatty-acid--CoA ligase [Methanomicrobia archaeon]
MEERYRDVYYTPLTPLLFLKRSAYVYRSETAVVYNDKQYTFQQFHERVNRAANALRKIGIEKDDKVSFISPNTPPFLEAHFSVPLSGGVLVPINIRLSPEEIAYIINNSDSKVLFVDSAFRDKVEKIKNKIPKIKEIITINDIMEYEGLEYEDFLRMGSKKEVDISLKDEYETITINYTSGTTGFPKGCMYHHRGAYLNSLAEIIEMSLNQYSSYLWTVPMFHCNGWCFTWAVPAAGAKSVCLRKVDPGKIFELIESENITHMGGAPTVWIMLTNYAQKQGIKKFPRRIIITVAGAPPPPSLLRVLEKMGAEVRQVYGLTETYGPHTICEWHPSWDNLSFEERAKRKSWQGVPYINAEVRVVDEEMNDIPRDGKTRGEIVMRGNNVIKGYYKKPEKTEEAFRNGVFHSGDIAVVHENGYIEVMDRAKDIIISGGENIASVEIEKVIYEHPEVLEVCVVPTPDDKWGEVPKAFIIAKQGANLTEEDIISFCRDRMAHFKCPKKVEFVKELPKTSTGKIQKYILREREFAGREKRVS